ncbi:MAG: recombination regulator RecX [Xanthomonadales bacterium]|jgi:regulatory protein|nr:recombination regulator RecX [Xanthomonadales bacterium]
MPSRGMPRTLTPASTGATEDPAEEASPDRHTGRIALDAAGARQRAIALLARREHSRAELTQKLGRAGCPAELLAPLLDALAAEGLLSEQRYVDSKTRSLIGRGKGPLAIRAALGRNLPAASEDAPDWVAQARGVLHKRFGEDPPADRNETARRMRFLAARGYTPAQIRAALEAVEED